MLPTCYSNTNTASKKKKKKDKKKKKKAEKAAQKNPGKASSVSNEKFDEKKVDPDLLRAMPLRDNPTGGR